MKFESESKTIQYAKSQKLISTIALTITTVGLATILGIVPDRYKTQASIALNFIIAIDSIYGVSISQDRIIEERKSKGDLYDKDEPEYARADRLSLQDSEIEGVNFDNTEYRGDE